MPRRTPAAEVRAFSLRSFVPGPSFLIVGIVLFGAALRLYGIGAESPWWDEIVTLEALDAPNLPSFLSEVRASDPPMTPVYFTAAWYWSRVGGTSVVWMRLLSVVLGLACIPALYVLGRRLFDGKSAAAAAIALSASLVHVYYSQEIRVYALATLLALLSMYAFARAVERDRRWRWWFAANIVLNALLAFTHLFGILLFAPQAVYLAGWGRHSRGRLVAWFAAHGVIGLALALWISTIGTATMHDAAGWMVKPGWREVAMVGAVFAGGRASNENPAAHLPGGVSLDLELATLAAVLVGWYLVHGRPHRAPVFLLLLCMLVPPAALLAASYVWRPCFVYRYILFASLPGYLLLGAAVVRPGRVRLVGVALAGCWAFQLVAVANGPFRPDWRAAARFLESNATQTDAVIALQSINYHALRYNSRLPDTSLAWVDVWSGVGPAVQEAHGAGRAAWVVVWLWNEPANIEADLERRGLKFGATDFAGWPGLRVYEVPAPARRP